MIEAAAAYCTNLEDEIEQRRLLGYRLDMIFPADSPREALLSRDDETLRLILQDDVRCYAVGDSQVSLPNSGPEPTWIKGRAGMEYQDLIPNRLGGKVIASRIRLPFDGEVPDVVHYHKIKFQVIACIAGAVKVVYEDQGKPFWLSAGEIIVQPPEIRHQVLECRQNTEVIEITLPAEHETWIDHGMVLGKGLVDPDRMFGGQRFVHCSLAEPPLEPARESSIQKATNGMVSAGFANHTGHIPSLVIEADGEIKLSLPVDESTSLEVRLTDWE